MNQYQAPAISGERALQGALGENGLSHFGPPSDAEIKHAVAPVHSAGYRAPTIIDERHLDGRLEDIRSIRNY